MTNILSKLFQLVRINPEEIRFVILMGFVLLLHSVAQQLAGIVSVSGFLSTGGVNGVLILWVIDMTLVLVITGLNSLIVDRFNRKTLLSWMLAGFALFYFILRLLFYAHVVDQIIYALMFIFSDLQFIIFPIIFWVLANDLSGITQSKRIFPVVASWGYFGKLIGIGIALIMPFIFQRFAIRAEEALYLNSGIYIITFIILQINLKTEVESLPKNHSETFIDNIHEGWDFIHEVKSFRFLILAILVGSMAITIIEFQFLNLTQSYFNTQGSYQSFYSGYRLVLTLASFGMQGFFTSRIIEKANLKNVFFILPVTLLIGSIVLLLPTGVIGAITGMFIPKLIQKTVDDSAANTFEGLVPEERRGRVSLFIESYPQAAGTILGALVCIALISLAGLFKIEHIHYFYISISLAASLVAIGMVAEMKTVYEVSLLNWRMKRRQRTSNIADMLDF
jgi:ATP:ADP antiporter, AAA family